MSKSAGQDKIFRRKCLSTGANFVHVYLEIWDTALLKFNKFSQEGQLSVSGERMCTILFNRLED